jgi:NAD(P)-dependent dehydrogenase (short-subunit alcohol dehydrogenase family)
MTMPAPSNNPGRVLISGGGSGLGASIAEAVAQAGGTPIVLDLNTSAVPEQFASYAVDVSDGRAAEQAVRQAAEEAGGLDAVVTAAGIDRPAPFGSLDGEAWEKVVMVNLLGTAAVIRGALPALEESRGRIVTVASSLALKAVPDATAYCASKFGVLGFSRALAAELAGRVGLTTLVPAGMKTHFFDQRDEQYRPTDDSKLNDPANVAAAVLFALSQPEGCEVRELVICHELEDSWP